MKKTLSLVLSLFIFCAIQATSALAESSIAGSYAGTWSDDSGSSGGINLELKHAATHSWSAGVKVSAAGDSVPVTVNSVTVDGGDVVIVFEYRVDGKTSSVNLKGSVEEHRFAGEFEVSNRKGKTTSTGTWSSTREI